MHRKLKISCQQFFLGILLLPTFINHQVQSTLCVVGTCTRMETPAVWSCHLKMTYLTLHSYYLADHKYISSNYLKGYPHSMMRRAYLRMKFSSLKMKRDRVLEAPMPGRLMLLALLATFRRLFSWLPSRGPSSPPPESADSPAILQKRMENAIIHLNIFCIFTFQYLCTILNLAKTREFWRHGKELSKMMQIYELNVFSDNATG